MRLLSGEEFNKLNTGILFVKLTNETENHNGFQFQTGLNVNTKIINITTKCTDDGIYFCEINKLALWDYYNGEQMVYCRPLKIPNDALVYVYDNKFETNKLILGDKREISTLQLWNNLNYCIKAVRLNKNIMKYIQSNDILKQVQQVLDGLNHVKIKTYYICLDAVKHNGMELKYICNDMDKIISDQDSTKFISQTEINSIYVEAIKQNHRSYIYINSWTKELFTELVKQNGIFIRFLPNDIFRPCTEEYDNFKRTIAYLDFTNDEISELSLIAVKQNGKAIEYIENQTEEICCEALKRGYHNYYSNQKFGTELHYFYDLLYVIFENIKHKNYNICLAAVKADGYMIQYISKPYIINECNISIEQLKELCFEAVKQNGLAIKYISKNFGFSLDELYWEAVTQNPDALELIPMQTYDICLRATNKNRFVVPYIREKDMKNLFARKHNICC
jgi:hypothetical protein